MGGRHGCVLEQLPFAPCCDREHALVDRQRDLLRGRPEHPPIGADEVLVSRTTCENRCVTGLKTYPCRVTPTWAVTFDAHAGPCGADANTSAESSAITGAL